MSSRVSLVFGVVLLALGMVLIALGLGLNRLVVRRVPQAVSEQEPRRGMHALPHPYPRNAMRAEDWVVDLPGASFAVPSTLGAAYRGRELAAKNGGFVLAEAAGSGHKTVLAAASYLPSADTECELVRFVHADGGVSSLSASVSSASGRATVRLRAGAGETEWVLDGPAPSSWPAWVALEAEAFVEAPRAHLCGRAMRLVSDGADASSARSAVVRALVGGGGCHTAALYACSSLPASNALYGGNRFWPYARHSVLGPRLVYGGPLTSWRYVSDAASPAPAPSVPEQAGGGMSVSCVGGRFAADAETGVVSWPGAYGSRPVESALVTASVRVVGVADLRGPSVRFAMRYADVAVSPPVWRHGGGSLWVQTTPHGEPPLRPEAVSSSVGSVSVHDSGDLELSGVSGPSTVVVLTARWPGGGAPTTSEVVVVSSSSAALSEETRASPSFRESVVLRAGADYRVLADGAEAGGAPPSLVNGQFPPGMVLDGQSVSGTPSRAGAYTSRVRWADGSERLTAWLVAPAAAPSVLEWDDVSGGPVVSGLPSHAVDLSVRKSEVLAGGVRRLSGYAAGDFASPAAPPGRSPTGDLELHYVYHASGTRRTWLRASDTATATRVVRYAAESTAAPATYDASYVLDESSEEWWLRPRRRAAGHLLVRAELAEGGAVRRHASTGATLLDWRADARSGAVVVRNPVPWVEGLPRAEQTVTFRLWSLGDRAPVSVVVRRAAASSGAASSEEKADASVFYSVPAVFVLGLPSQVAPLFSNTSHAVSATGLPAGLTMGPLGAVTGVPTEVGAGTMQVTVEGTGTFALDYEVRGGLQYPLDFFVYGTGNTVRVEAPRANNGGGVYRYDAFRVSPPLPPGMSLDPRTGGISGTSQVSLDFDEYTVSADVFNLSGVRVGVASVPLYMRVEDSALVVLDDADESERLPKWVYPPVLFAGVPGTVELQSRGTVREASPVGAFALVENGGASQLPGTVSIDESSGLVTATIDVPGDLYDFRVTDGVHAQSAFVTLVVHALVTYNGGSPVSFKVGEPVELAPDPAPFATTERQVAYSLGASEQLPEGLSLDASTGVISGTPVSAVPAADYSVGGSVTMFDDVSGESDAPARGRLTIEVVGEAAAEPPAPEPPVSPPTVSRHEYVRQIEFIYAGAASLAAGGGLLAYGSRGD